MLLLLDEEASAEVRINTALTRQLPNVISVIKPELGFHFHIWNFGQFVILAPIKRPLSIKNTYPSQKSTYFCRNKTQSQICTFWPPAPGFSKVLVADANRSATRHPSGSRSMKENVNFFLTPGPWDGPQKNIGSLLWPMDCHKIKGSNRASHRGLMTRADQTKSTSAWILV